VVVAARGPRMGNLHNYLATTNLVLPLPRLANFLVMITFPYCKEEVCKVWRIMQKQAL